MLILATTGRYTYRLPTHAYLYITYLPVGTYRRRRRRRRRDAILELRKITKAEPTSFISTACLFFPHTHAPHPQFLVYGLDQCCFVCLPYYHSEMPIVLNPHKINKSRLRITLKLTMVRPSSVDNNDIQKHDYCFSNMRL